MVQLEEKCTHLQRDHKDLKQRKKTHAIMIMIVKAPHNVKIYCNSGLPLSAMVGLCRGKGEGESDSQGRGDLPPIWQWLGIHSRGKGRHRRIMSSR